MRDYEFEYSPFAILRKQWKRWLPDAEPIDAGPYLVLRFTILIIALVMAASDVLLLRCIACAISLFLIGDILVAHLSIAFVSQFPADPLRSVTFALFSFFQLAVAFGVFFAAPDPSFSWVGKENEPPMRISWLNSLYFSLLIITTVGWGDILPHHDASLLRAIISLELIVALSFLVSVLQIMTSWSSRHPAAVPKDLNELPGPKS
jgi:hypothetical protein